MCCHLNMLNHLEITAPLLPASSKANCFQCHLVGFFLLLYLLLWQAVSGHLVASMSLFPFSLLELGDGVTVFASGIFPPRLHPGTSALLKPSSQWAPCNSAVRLLLHRFLNRPHSLPFSPTLGYLLWPGYPSDSCAWPVGFSFCLSVQAVTKFLSPASLLYLLATCLWCHQNLVLAYVPKVLWRTTGHQNTSSFHLFSTLIVLKLLRGLCLSKQNRISEGTWRKSPYAFVTAKNYASCCGWQYSSTHIFASIPLPL